MRRIDSDPEDEPTRRKISHIRSNEHAYYKPKKRNHVPAALAQRTDTFKPGDVIKNKQKFIHNKPSKDSDQLTRQEIAERAQKSNINNTKNSTTPPTKSSNQWSSPTRITTTFSHTASGIRSSGSTSSTNSTPLQSPTHPSTSNPMKNLPLNGQPTSASTNLTSAPKQPKRPIELSSVDEPTRKVSKSDGEGDIERKYKELKVKYESVCSLKTALNDDNMKLIKKNKDLCDRAESHQATVDVLKSNLEKATNELEVERSLHKKSKEAVEKEKMEFSKYVEDKFRADAAKIVKAYNKEKEEFKKIFAQKCAEFETYKMENGNSKEGSKESEEVAKLENEVKELKKNLEDELESNKKLTDENADYKTKITFLSQTVDDAMAKLDKFSETSEQFEALKTELADEKTTNRRLVGESAIQQEEIGRLSAKNEEFVGKFSMLEEMDEKIRKFENDIAKSIEENTRYIEKYNNSEKALLELKVTCENWKDNATKLEKGNKELKVEIGMINAKLSAATNMNASLQATNLKLISDHAEELSEYVAEYEANNKQSDELMTMLNDANGSADSWREKYYTIYAEVQKMSEPKNSIPSQPPSLSPISIRSTDSRSSHLENRQPFDEKDSTDNN